MAVVGPNQKPDPHPFYGDSWERGLDPWHAGAFPKKFKHAGTTGQRNMGWFLVDAYGNQIGFVPDGAPLEYQPERMVIAEARE